MPTLSHFHQSHSDVFAVPVADKFLLYAPLHNLAALVDLTAALRLRDGLLTGDPVAPGPLSEIVRVLNGGAEPPPAPRQGDFVPPFLGLLPTRGCKLSCQYCGFLTPQESEVMNLELARDAVNWYMDTVRQVGAQHAEIHFFGGEPFCVEEVLDITVHLARIRAEEIGCTVRFEVATNGVFGEERCRWAADNLDTIVMSLDGPAEIQDRYRPYRGGQSSSETVERSARILSAGAANLFLRACVTSQTVAHMPEIAARFCDDFRPSGVCFESLQPSEQSSAAQLEPPDPWDFAHNFIQAAWVLESHGVEPVYAAADARARRVSFCPVGQDVAIISPDGTISACYLLRRDWEAKGLDLRLGRMGDGRAQLRADAVASVRSLNVHTKPFCAHCFCKWHCAGGCHVNHAPSGPPGAYDRLCIQTRIISLRNLLKAMGQDRLVPEWLGDREVVERSVYQASDSLLDLEGGS
ncbi:MAG: radical SAM protein [Chloroflexi bacterium]|nr:radical SAM protein [Chloroflexota bacterium]